MARHEATAAERDVDVLRLAVIARAKSSYAEWRFINLALGIHNATPALATLQRLVLTQHPELARVDAQVAARKDGITLAEKAFYPGFKLGVGYNSFRDNADKRPVFAVAINVPPDRSKLRSELSRAHANKRRAEWSLVERRADLLADLAQARAEVVKALAAVTLYEDRLVPLASEYFEAALADCQSGTGAFLNVITAEQRKLSTDLAQAHARTGRS